MAVPHTAFEGRPLHRSPSIARCIGRTLHNAVAHNPPLHKAHCRASPADACSAMIGVAKCGALPNAVHCCTAKCGAMPNAVHCCQMRYTARCCVLPACGRHAMPTLCGSLRDRTDEACQASIHKWQCKPLKNLEEPPHPILRLITCCTHTGRAAWGIHCHVAEHACHPRIRHPRIRNPHIRPRHATQACSIQC